ncbi:MAG TPA: tetratricopeptide repeat protein, partial [Anaerolineae bacterium]|nr:tetratricopeptide repeat protein [Anaerolineae bacterium]
LQYSVAELNGRWLDRLPLLSELLGLAIPDTTTTRALETSQRQAMLFDFVLDLLSAWSNRQPRVIILEDVQWLDEASQQLTLALARAIADKPILFTVVHRDDRSVLAELDQTAQCHTIGLAQLSDESLHTIVTQRLQGQIDPLVVELIQRRTQGNPLFIEQLVEALADSAKLVRSEEGRWSLAETVLTTLLSAGCVEKREGVWALTETAALSAADLDIPDTLQALVQSRLDRLTPDHKLTLKAAGVIGEEFNLELLERSHPAHIERAQLEEHVHLFAAHDLLRLSAALPHVRYAFAHPVLQEVTYASVPDEQRRLIHGAVGAALEVLQPERIEQLAHHYDRSDFDEKAVFYLDKAARSAQLKGVNRTALTYFTRALRRADQWEWRKGKVEAWHGLGERDEELLELRALDAVAGVPLSETARLWSDYYEATGDYPQAQAYIEQALRDYGQRSNILGKARCLNQLGAIAARQGEFDQAREWYNRALDVVANEGDRSAEEPLVVIRTLNGLGIAACQQGHYAESKRNFEYALELSRLQGNRLDEAQALNNLGMLAAYQRDFDRAQQQHREALEIRRAIGHRTGEGLSAYNLAVAYVEAGSYAEAETYFKTALSIAQALGNRWDEVNVLNGLGGLYLLLGDMSQAETYLQKCLGVACEIADDAGRAYALCNLGQVLRDTGNLTAAEQSLTEALNLAQTQNDMRLISLCRSHLSVVNLLAGQLEQAMAQAKQSLVMRHEIGLDLSTTIDLAMLAAANLSAGEVVAALDFAEQAASVLDAHGGAGAEFPHRDYYTCYQVFLAAGQVERALAALQSAYRLVTRIGDKITDAGMRESFLTIPVNHEIMNEYLKHWPTATQRT